MSAELRVALLQTDSGPDVEKNLNDAAELTAQAAAAGAQLVCLPECCDYIGPGTNLPAYDLSGPTAQRLASLAKKHGLWLLAGSICEAHKGKPYNTSLLFNPQGTLKAAYRKLHLYDVDLSDGTSVRESDRRSAGKERVCASTPWGGLGMTVCYDLRFSELWLALARDGARLITVPANFTTHTGSAHWEVLVRARALDTGCFVLAPGQTGTKPAFKAWGHSMIADPWGRVVAQVQTDEPQVLLADLDLSLIEAARTQLPLTRHRRPECYR